MIYAALVYKQCKNGSVKRLKTKKLWSPKDAQLTCFLFRLLFHPLPEAIFSLKFQGFKDLLPNISYAKFQGKISLFARFSSRALLRHKHAKSTESMLFCSMFSFMTHTRPEFSLFNLSSIFYFPAVKTCLITILNSNACNDYFPTIDYAKNRIRKFPN